MEYPVLMCKGDGIAYRDKMLKQFAKRQFCAPATILTIAVVSGDGFTQRLPSTSRIA